MTDRISGFLVTLENDIREDDAQDVIKSIALTKGVLSVMPVKTEPLGQIISTRVRQEVIKKLLELME